VLHAFGGAGATHAPAFALDVVDTVVVPAGQSVHSALGAASSDVSLTAELAVPMRLSRDAGAADADPDEVERVFRDLERWASVTLAEQGVPAERRELARVVEVRFTRQTKALPVPYPGSVEALLEDFLSRYARRYGAEAVPDTAGFELVTFAVEATGRLPRPQPARHARATGEVEPVSRRRAYDAATGELAGTAIFDGPSLRPGHRLAGPAIVEYPGSTVALCSGQVAEVDELLNIEIRRAR
jgi:N-methylhydantoinase A